MKFLVHITLGNIQGFIGTARRTRDLWFGSFVLSELSKAAALHLRQVQPGCLVFPVERGASCNGALNLHDERFSVANVVAVLTCNDKAGCAAVLTTAKTAVSKKWQAFAADAQAKITAASVAGGRRRRDSANAQAFLREEVWTAQLDDVVDYIAAAVPLADDSNDAYAKASQRLDDLLAARKRTHVFRQYAERSAPALALPKSSLDGAQSTAIQEARTDNRTLIARTRRRMGIEPAEQLDAAGIVKRVVGRGRAFVPVARVASELWLAQAQQQYPRQFDVLVKAYDEACDSDVADYLGTDLGPGTSERYPWVRKFRYDAQLLYPPRIDAALIAARQAMEADSAEYGATPDQRNNSLVAIADALLEALKPLWTALGSPQPYYAMIYADGDRMGKLVRASANFGAEAQRSVSQSLSTFAEAVPGILNKHRGASIYAGGDDVLALVGLDQAVACADALQSAFREAMSPAAKDCGITDPKAQPTLRVGIVIAHYLMPLADVREAAKRAGDVAKYGTGAPLPPGEQGNALGVWLQPRSGAGLALRLRWDDQQAVQRLRDQIAYLSAAPQRLPSGLPNEVGALYQSFAALPAQQQSAGVQHDLRLTLFSGALETLLGRKRLDDGSSLLAGDRQQVVTWLTAQGDSATESLGWEQVGQRCCEFAVARWLAGHTEQAEES